MLNTIDVIQLEKYEHKENHVVANDRIYFISKNEIYYFNIETGEKHL